MFAVLANKACTANIDTHKFSMAYMHVPKNLRPQNSF